jgi:sialidase-1
MKAQLFQKHRTKVCGILAILAIAGVSGYYIYIQFRYRMDPDLEYTCDLFSHGENGYDTFRIPGLLILPDDIILAFCEGRVESASDYGNIDLVMKRSTDRGDTWSDLQVLWNFGDLSVQNPCPVYEETTGKIFLHVVTDRQDHYVLESEDLGLTWSDPVKLATKVDDWSFGGPSPGHGIQLQSGRLLIPGMYCPNANQDGEKEWGAYLIYSDDNGETWEIGHIFPQIVNECMVVELDNGTIMTILRINRETEYNYKLVSFSNDEGNTSSTPVENFDLITPICQSSIIRLSSNHSNTGDGKSRLLYSHPNNPSQRMNFTLRVSYDEGQTWAKSRVVYPGSTAYSDLAVLSDFTICGLVERGAIRYQEHITFFRTDIDWISSGTDTL